MKINEQIRLSHFLISALFKFSLKLYDLRNSVQHEISSLYQKLDKSDNFIFLRRIIENSLYQTQGGQPQHPDHVL